MLDTKSGHWSVTGPDPLDRPGEPALRKHVFGLGSIIRRRNLIGLSCLLFVVFGLIYVSVRTKTYTASTQLLVYTRELQQGPETVILPGRADVALVQNQIEIIQSRNVLVKVVETLKLDKDPEFATVSSGLLQELKRLLLGEAADSDRGRLLVNLALQSLKSKLVIQRIGASHTILIVFRASNPTKSARIANEIARAYLQERASFWEGGPSRAPSLRERLQGLGPSAYVISEAEPPAWPDGPRSALILIAAASFGLAAGTGLALALDFVDRTLRTPEQVEYVLGIECFGVIPYLGDKVPAARQDPRSVFAQGVRRAVMAIHDPSAREIRSVGITSAVPGEGATTVAANMSLLLAGMGKRVLLIDAVAENPSLSRLLAPNAKQGLVESLGRSGTLAPGAIVTDPQSGLHILPLNHRPATNLASYWWALLDDFVRKATETWDLVIVDLPSLASGPDVRTAAQTLDAFVLVLKWGDTNAELIQRAMQSSGSARTKFVGAILNMADEKTIGTYGDKFSACEFALAAKRRGQEEKSSFAATRSLAQ